MRRKLTEEQRLRQANTRLLNENKKLRERVKELEELSRSQQEVIEKLVLEVEELKRKKFGKKKETKQTKKKEPEERSKGSYKRREPKDSEVTEEHHHSVDTCEDCGETLTNKKIVIFWIEDISLPVGKESRLKNVIKHTVEKGWCNRCKKWKTAIPVPSTNVLLGENTKMYITYCAIVLRLTYEQIVRHFSDKYTMTLSDGEISNILDKEANILEPQYDYLIQNIRGQKGIHYDETSWDVQNGDQGNYAWVMTGTENNNVVFRIGRSRGRGNAKELQGDSKSVGISDDYGAYRRLFDQHQLCFSHPHRKLRDLATSDRLDEETQKHCKKTYDAFGTLYSDVRSVLSKPFGQKEREEYKESFLVRIENIAQPHKKDPKKLQNIKEGLLKNKEKYFTCIMHDGIPADNNKAERMLRHLVIKRKISFGSKSQKGADRLNILLSCLLSLQNTKPENFFDAYASLRKKLSPSL